jgi:hypothetical protein
MAACTSLQLTYKWIMSQERNIGIASRLLAGLGEGKEPGVIAALFGEDVVFEIPGDAGVLPWIGRKTGREAVAGFIRDLRGLTEPIKFDVHDILSSDARAVILANSRRGSRGPAKLLNLPSRSS